MEIVKRASLVEERRVRRVQVFRDTIAAFQNAPTEGDHSPARILNRQHQPPAKTVIGSFVFDLDMQTALDQHLRIELTQRALQRCFAIGRKTEPELAANLAAETAPFEIIERLSPIRRAQIVKEPALRCLHDVNQTCALLRLFCSDRIGRGDFHTGLCRQLFHRIHKAEPALVSHPADHIAMRAAAKAMVETLLVIDREAWRFLVVKGAARFPFAPGLLQLVRAHNDGGQRHSRAQFVEPLRGKCHAL